MDEGDTQSHQPTDDSPPPAVSSTLLVGKKRRVVDSSDVEEEDDRGSTKPKKAATPSATTASQTTETLDTGAENESKSMSNGESAKKKLKTDEASKSVKGWASTPDCFDQPSMPRVK